MKQYYVFFGLLLLSSCSDSSQTDLDEIYAMMEGKFTSKIQAEKDPNYYDKTLQLAHIWEERDGHWIYAEYGLTDKPDTPYSQRVYQLTSTPDKGVVMIPFVLKNNKDFIGKWESPKDFDTITLDDLELRDGCAVYFRKEEGAYIGETKAETCNHGLGKANYWTHQFVVSQDRIINWARGYDAKDRLIWGLPDGGYVLEEIE